MATAAEDGDKAPPTLLETNQEEKQSDEGSAPIGSKEAMPKPHPPTPTGSQADIEPPTAVPSKSDINSLTSLAPTPLPSSENVSDPLAIPSTSLSKLPPLKKTSLPPLLPPIGGSTSVDKETERKEGENDEDMESKSSLDHPSSDNKGERGK